MGVIEHNLQNFLNIFWGVQMRLRVKREKIHHLSDLVLTSTLVNNDCDFF